jgi:hypothetical protein
MSRFVRWMARWSTTVRSLSSKGVNMAEDDDKNDEKKEEEKKSGKKYDGGPIPKVPKSATSK